MICRSLWNARNRAQFDKMHSHRIAIVQSATSLLEEYQRLASSLPPVKPMGQIMRLTNTLYSFILLFFILPFHLSKLGTSLRWSISCPSSSDTPTFVFLFSSIYFYHFVQKKEKQNTLIFKYKIKDKINILLTLYHFWWITYSLLFSNTFLKKKKKISQKRK